MQSATQSPPLARTRIREVKLPGHYVKLWIKGKPEYTPKEFDAEGNPIAYETKFGDTYTFRNRHRGTTGSINKAVRRFAKYAQKELQSGEVFQVRFFLHPGNQLLGTFYEDQPFTISSLMQK